MKKLIQGNLSIYKATRISDGTVELAKDRSELKAVLKDTIKSEMGISRVVTELKSKSFAKTRTHIVQKVVIPYSALSTIIQ